ncbi:hypothetical protein [Pelagibius sp.]|uniref:hypothetical protein n=1 Tax=Pelagibius sp. TaxID=1931238 RepID=UPI0026317962|nr:hypothetical protein [Pelagibius sp.]
MTLLSLWMGWLTFWAVFGAALSATKEVGWPVYIDVIMGAYALTAGATTLGLWRMKPWTLTAFRTWGVVCLGLMIVFFLPLQMPERLAAEPVEVGTLFVATTGTMILVYWLMHRYIKRRVANPQ